MTVINCLALLRCPVVGLGSLWAPAGTPHPARPRACAADASGGWTLWRGPCRRGDSRWGPGAASCDCTVRRDSGTLGRRWSMGGPSGRLQAGKPRVSEFETTGRHGAQRGETTETLGRDTAGTGPRRIGDRKNIRVLTRQGLDLLLATTHVQI